MSRVVGTSNVTDENGNVTSTPKIRESVVREPSTKEITVQEMKSDADNYLFSGSEDIDEQE